jgi:hypothetical protein
MKKNSILLGVFSLFFLQSCNVFKTSTRGYIMTDSVKNIQKRIKKRKHDTIVLKDGVYRDVFFRFPKESANIILTAETPGGVVITGKSKIIVSGKKITIKDLLFYNVKGYENGKNRILILKDTDSCRITNCAFVDCGTPYTNQKIAAGGLIVYLDSNAKNNRIDHCFWEGSFGICLAIGYKPNHEASLNNSDRVNRNNTIDNCYVKNISEWADLNGKALNGNDPFMIGWDLPPYAPKSNNIVTHNLFENISSDSEIISVKLSNSTVSFNTLRNSPKTKFQSPQIIIRTGNNSVVKGNFFINTGAGLTVHGDNHEIFNNYIDSDYMGIYLPGGKINEYSYPGQNNCSIYNNTIVNTQFPFMFGKDNWTIKPGDKKNNRIINNIIYIDKKKLGDIYNKPIIFLDRDYKSANKIFWNNNTVFFTTKESYTTSKYQRFISQHKLTPNNINFINPNYFINENGLYELKANSKLISKNIGQQIIRDKQKTIDNLETKRDLIISTLDNTIRPLYSKDVGPKWITDYTNFKSELIDYWKEWKLDDAIIDNNPAVISTPHFNSSNSILQFDLTNALGIEIRYDSIINKYTISCQDNQPRFISIPIQDFNENPLKNINKKTVALIEKRIVKEVGCKDRIEVIGNGEKVEFRNNLNASMLVSSKKIFKVINGDKMLLDKNKNYFVRLEDIPTKNMKCLIKYIIKPHL